ncbi:MAG: phosphopyruvate hydratase [Acidobacteriota bacterium]
MNIHSISAYQVYDSRGNPTVEAEVILESGERGRGTVPSGASTGQFEALELRDGDPRSFRGKSVFNAIANIHREIAPALAGWDVHDQAGLDRKLIELDGTPSKSRLGANAILAVSMAAAHAAAAALRVPLYDYLGQSRGTLLPLPEIQIIGGGAHAHWRTDVQDFLLIATGASSFQEVMEITFNVHRAAGELMEKRGALFGVADEGGYWPEFSSNEAALQLMTEAIVHAGYTPGRDAAISLDIAASDLYDSETQRYLFALENRSFTSAEFAALQTAWCDRYPIVSIEDPMADTDWDGWSAVASALRNRVQLVGDDLFTTNLERIRAGIERNLANAVLIKLNQIGTVTETLAAIELTQSAGWNPIISARSGETEDAFISHLAVATNAGQLKVGSFTRGERMAKWNEVLRIERDLGQRARFMGRSILDRVVMA